MVHTFATNLMRVVRIEFWQSKTHKETYRKLIGSSIGVKVKSNTTIFLSLCLQAAKNLLRVIKWPYMAPDRRIGAI